MKWWSEKRIRYWYPFKTGPDEYYPDPDLQREVQKEQEVIEDDLAKRFPGCIPDGRGKTEDEDSGAERGQEDGQGDCPF